MKLNKFVLLLLPLILIACADENRDPVQTQKEKELSKFFYKKMHGTIGDELKIVMNLVRIDTALQGNYFYEKIGKPIPISYKSTIDDSGNVYIEEYTGKYDSAYNPVASGIFKGKFLSADKLSGHWSKPGSDKRLNFLFEENYPEGTAMFDYRYFLDDYKDSLVNVEFIFPVMINFADKSVTDSINDNIKHNLIYSFGDGGASTMPSYKAWADSFIEMYKDEIEADTSIYGDYKPRYSFDHSTNILFNSSYILSLEKINYQYLGGAHGLTGISLHSFNLKNGSELKLNDILRGNFKDEFKKKGIDGVRKYFNMKPGESFKDFGLFIDEEEFALNDNFALMKNGIKFQFGQYELGPYALGSPEILIEYNDIEQFIIKDSILGEMIF